MHCERIFIQQWRKAAIVFSYVSSINLSFSTSDSKAVSPNSSTSDLFDKSNNPLPYQFEPGMKITN